MKPFSLKIKLITPLFSYGANNKKDPQPEIRVASIRGMLRWWANALLSSNEVMEIFGGEQDKSPMASRVRIRMSPMLQFKVGIRNLLPHPCNHQSPKKAIVEGTEFELQFSECLNGKRGLDERFIRVLKCWLLLGALGGRSNRGAGSFSWEWEGLVLPGSCDEYARLAANVLQGSPLQVAVLTKEFTTAEAARKAASDTVAGGVGHNALGSINPRVPSPLKLRVIELPGPRGGTDRRYALVAIWDGRKREQEGRSDLKSAIDELQRCNKEIGELLRNSALYDWCCKR